MTGVFVDGIHVTIFLAAPWIYMDPSWAWDLVASFDDLIRRLMGFLWDLYMIEWGKMMKQNMLL